MSRLGGGLGRIAPNAARALSESADAPNVASMENDNPAADLDSLRAEHRRLDERIHALVAEGGVDQLQIARLKRRKLMLKDRIERIADTNIPDIIA
jgi:hypothetical protein